MNVSLDFLPQTAFIFILIFARVGAMAMALPGIGDKSVPSRVRLVFALTLTLVFYPIVEKQIATIPVTLLGLGMSVAGETLVGLVIGISVRMITAGLQLAGSAIAFQTGLAFAQTVDPGDRTQNPIIASFLSVLAVTLIFATDLHHLLLGAMNDSYKLFKPGAVLPVGDLANSAVGLLGRAFRVAIQIAAPFLVFGLIFNLGIGVLSRLTPQIQVFFIAMPANIFIGMVLLMLLLSSMMMWYLSYFGEAVSVFLVSGQGGSF